MELRIKISIILKSFIFKFSKMKKLVGISTLPVAVFILLSTIVSPLQTFGEEVEDSSTPREKVEEKVGEVKEELEEKKEVNVSNIHPRFCQDRIVTKSLKIGEMKGEVEEEICVAALNDSDQTLTIRMYFVDATEQPGDAPVACADEATERKGLGLHTYFKENNEQKEEFLYTMEPGETMETVAYTKLPEDFSGEMKGCLITEIYDGKELEEGKINVRLRRGNVMTFDSEAIPADEMPKPDKPAEESVGDATTDTEEEMTEDVDEDEEEMTEDVTINEEVDEEVSPASEDNEITQQDYMIYIPVGIAILLAFVIVLLLFRKK